MQFLPNITDPSDIRNLSLEDKETLIREIRETIIETVSHNGGHLASNLGIVETTLALHCVFSCPTDKILFDVGHQCYAHKLLTGRYDKFSTLRKSGGISGFTNRDESEFDTITAGHSGTALSTAIGIAEANRIAGHDSWVAAVVGDGSFTNGMVYEALNQLVNKKLKLVIVLNDNEMSISKNVGGLSAYLSMIRTSEGYFNFKMYAKRIFSKIPLIGERLIGAARGIRDFLKRISNSESFFENLGIEYIGPANGNDSEKMMSVLEEAKSKGCPVVVHIKTKKGLGYAPSEEHPERYHSTGAFSEVVEEPESERKVKSQSFTDVSSRLLVRFGEENSNICTITAAMAEGCGLTPFAERFPERFFDVGIAEEHAVTMAGGLALGGMCPIIVMYSTFSQRVFDQLWHDICLQRTHVVMILSHAGLVPGDGVTHQGVYDVAVFSRLPNTTVYSPDTFAGYEKALARAIGEDALTIVRYPKGGQAIYPSEVRFDDHDSWRSTVIGSGDERILIVTYGRISTDVVRAAQNASKKKQIAIETVILRRIVPLPDDPVFNELMGSHDRIIFVEEGVRSGGIGEALAARVNGKIEIAAIDESFIPHGDVKLLAGLVGIDTEALERRILREDAFE